MPQIEEKIVHQLHLSHGIFHIHLPIYIYMYMVCKWLYICWYIFSHYSGMLFSRRLKKIQIISASPRSLCSFDGRSRLFVYIFSKRQRQLSENAVNYTSQHANKMLITKLVPQSTIFQQKHSTWEVLSMLFLLLICHATLFAQCYWHALPIWIS